jgi:hypothetical protein
MGEALPLIQRVIAEIPSFTSNLLDFSAGPKTFLARKDLAAKSVLTGALTFYVLCLLISFVLYLPFQPKDTNVSLYIAKTLVYSVVICLVLTAITRLAWRCVGGRVRLRVYFVVSLYLFGLLTLLASLAALVAKGVVRVYAPDQLNQFITFVDQAAMLNAGKGIAWLQTVSASEQLSVTAAYLLWVVLGQAAFWTYLLLTWGTYRSRNGLSQGRSVTALLLWYVFLLPACYLMIIGAQALDLMLF